MDNRMYYTSAEAWKAAQECASWIVGAQVKPAMIDDRARDIEDDDNFREIVGIWSGEASAYAVEVGGDTIAKLGFWIEGELMREIEFEGHKVRLYVVDDEFVLNFGTGAGWAQYPRDAFTLSEALVDQYFLDCENVDAEERARIAESAREVAEQLKMR